jgi:hypothetical protein
VFNDGPQQTCKDTWLKAEKKEEYRKDMKPEYTYMKEDGQKEN